jgi:hypothetical protein
VCQSSGLGSVLLSEHGEQTYVFQLFLTAHTFSRHAWQLLWTVTFSQLPNTCLISCHIFRWLVVTTLTDIFCHFILGISSGISDWILNHFNIKLVCHNENQSPENWRINNSRHVAIILNSLNTRQHNYVIKNINIAYTFATLKLFDYLKFPYATNTES